MNAYATECSALSAPRDPQTCLTAELTSLQCAIWLAELRQADVKQQLVTYRLRRAALGRAYRRLLPLVQE